MRMPKSYTSRTMNTALAGGCFYTTIPTQYHRYGYRGFRGPIDVAADQRERFNSHVTGTCDVKANYVDGDTITVTVQVIEGSGINGPAAIGHYDAWTFEYDVAGDGVTPGNIAIDISGATTAAEVCALTLAALRTVLHGYLTAEAGATTADFVIVGKGPHVLVSVASSGVPIAPANVTMSGDDVALQPRGAQVGAIEYRWPASGPLNAVVNDGVESLWSNLAI